MRQHRLTGRLYCRRTGIGRILHRSIPADVVRHDDCRVTCPQYRPAQYGRVYAAPDRLYR